MKNVYCKYVPLCPRHLPVSSPHRPAPASHRFGRKRVKSPLVALVILLTLFTGLSTFSLAQAPRVLFIGSGDEAINGADGVVWEMMIEWWGEENLTYIQSGASTTEDAAQVDVVVLSSTPGSGDIRNKFHEVEVGVVNWEEALGRQLSLGEMGITTGNRQKYTLSEISIEDNSHLITSGLDLGTFQLLENPAETWGSQWGISIDSTDPAEDELIAPGAKILANVPFEAADEAGHDFRVASLVAVETGDELWQDALDPVPAPGRRVMFPLTDSTANELTEGGWDLLKRSIEWAGGVLKGDDLPLIAHFPLDADGNSADGSFVADDVVDVTFGQAGANANTGSAASFNGASSRIQHEWEEALNPDGSFTLALWTQSNGGAGAWNSPVTSRHDLNNEGAASQGYLIYDNQPSGVWTFWSGNGEEEGNWQVLDGPEVTVGEWEHVAITYDDDEKMKALYVNGELVAESEDSIAPNDTTPFNIGAGQDNGDGFWFDGLIDDIGLWGTVLTEAQIQQVMEGGVASLEGAPDLLITFDEGEELPEGIVIEGNAEVREEGGVDDTGYLSVTDALGSQSGTVIFPDLLGGKIVKSFKFKADIRVGGGSDPNPADGFSINLVRPDDKVLSGGGFNVVPEEGTVTGLSIGFDEWDSGGGELVGFSVHVDGEVVTEVEASIRNGDADDPESLQTGPLGPDGAGDASLLTWQPFEVELKEDGKVSISWKGTKVLTDFQTTFNPGPVQIVLGGRTGGANSNHHVDNIELSIDALDVLAVARTVATTQGLSFEVLNSDESVLNKESVALKVDGQDVVPTITDIEGGVRIDYVADPGWLPGTTHTYELVAQDAIGLDAIRSGAGEVSLKDGLLPYLTALPGPDPIEGMWSVRYIFDAGTIGGLQAAVNAVQAASEPDFQGQVVDVAQQFMDEGVGGGGIFTEAESDYPDPVLDNEFWTGEDFVVFGRAFINITDPGTYTFGIHTDDGYALRIFGATFSAENGGGQLDTVSPDTIAFPAPTGNSNSRGTVELAAGSYEVEFIWYERGGGDGGELYAAKGDFLTDEDTDTWALVGHPDGIQLGGASALPFQITNIIKAGTDVTITWESSEGAGYTIERATPTQLISGEFDELEDGFEGQEGSSSFTDTGVADGELYYRIRQEN